MSILRLAIFIRTVRATGLIDVRASYSCYRYINNKKSSAVEAVFFLRNLVKTQHIVSVDRGGVGRRWEDCPSEIYSKTLLWERQKGSKLFTTTPGCQEVIVLNVVAT
jgi:hypothetical protein